MCPCDFSLFKCSWAEWWATQSLMNQRGNSLALASLHLVKQDQHFCERFLPWCAVTCCTDRAVCCLCTWPCVRRVTRWTTYLSVFLFRDYTDWLFLWPGCGSMGRAVPERPSLWAEVLEPAACWPHSWASPWNSSCRCCQWCSLIALSRAQQSAALSASAFQSMRIWLELPTELLCFVVLGFLVFFWQVFGYLCGPRVSP